MPILNIQTNNVGLAGTLPQPVYIQTTDPVATVTAAGYLNAAIAEGVQISRSNIAYVITQESPNAPLVTALYYLSFSAGKWSLTQVSAGGGGGSAWLLGGNTLGAPNTIGSNNAEDIAIEANGFSYFQFQVGTQRIFGQASIFDMQTTGEMSLTSTGGGIVTIDSAGGNILVGSSGAATVFLGNPAGAVQIDSSSLNLSSLPSVAPAGLFNLVADGSGNVSFSNVPNASGTAWLVGGNASIAGPGSYFGTSDGSTLYMKTNNVQFLQVDSAQNMQFDSHDLTWNATGAVVLFGPGASSLQIGFTGLPVVIFADNFLVQTNAEIHLHAATDTHIESGTDILIECSGVGGLLTLGNFGHVTGLYGSNIDSYAQGGTASFDADITLNLGASFAATVVLAGVATTLTIASPAAVTTFDATSLSLPNMPAAVGGEKIVMIDTVTGQLRISP